ncbi:MAG: AsnC family transcriptional regulator [Hadesarchaea archaeon YNP_N21]|jgi:DNA-binding Lrp family transcriptional regulator|nr:MAG: AsnC family transcriptional regulator [Hadesarchaea archaeon YNP_N21]
MPEKIELKERQLSILRKLLKEGKTLRIKRVEKNQFELANELGITRQALSGHLRELKKLGLLTTGRGFIDLTQKTMRMLGEKSDLAFIFAKIEPKLRRKAYNEISELDVFQIYRVTGDVDLIIQVERSKLDKVLKSLSQIKGVQSTSTHIVLNQLVGEK